MCAALLSGGDGCGEFRCVCAGGLPCGGFTGHGAVAIHGGAHILCWGGCMDSQEGFYMDPSLCVLVDTATWEVNRRLLGGHKTPSSRSHFVMVNLPHEQTLIMFGKQKDDTLCNDGFLLSHDTLECKAAVFTGEVPSPREGACACLLDHGALLFVWGGFGEEGFLADGYTMDTDTLHWQKVSLGGGEEDAASSSASGNNNTNGGVGSSASRKGPLPRFLHTAVSLSPSEVLVWGGMSNAGPVRENFVLRMEAPDTWSYSPVGVMRGPLPSPRFGHTMCGVAPHRVLLWGGYSGSADGFLGEGYLLNTVSWEWCVMEPQDSPKESSLPSPRYGHAAVPLPLEEDSRDDQVVLLGGFDGSFCADVWLVEVPEDSGGGPEGGRRGQADGDELGARDHEFDFQLSNKVMGRGTFGEVVEALVTRGPMTGKSIAVKQLPFQDEQEKRSILREVQLLQKLHHPNIVRYLCVREEGILVSIAMEKCSSSLEEKVRLYRGLPLDMARSYTKQIMEGLQYLHLHHVMHRDLKCSNILLMEPADGPAVIKVADFGCSKVVEKEAATQTMNMGTLAYCAPEMFIWGDSFQDKVRYGKKVDVWALGCCLLEMLTGKRPYHECAGRHQLTAKLTLRKERPFIPKDIQGEARDFLLCCLSFDQDQRPSVEELLQHPFIVSPSPPRDGGSSSS